MKFFVVNTLNSSVYPQKKLKFNALILTAAFALSISTLSACEKDQGGFGEAQSKDKSGRLHAPTVEKKAPDFKNAFILSPSFDKKKHELKIKLALKDGFHAYAKGETIGKPIELKIGDAGNWKLDGTVQYPVGKKKDLGDLGESMILEGDVFIFSKVKDGKGKINATLMVQVCTDTACDRPRPYAFSLATDS